MFLLELIPPALKSTNAAFAPTGAALPGREELRNKLPFYKMYPADADTDENFRRLTNEELGVYWRCLNHAWVNDGLPSNPEEIAKLLRESPAKFKKVWRSLESCFSISGDRYVNKRQENERKEAIAKSEKATKSVRTRYERKSNVGIRASGSGSVSSVVVETTKTESTSSRALRVVPDAEVAEPPFQILSGIFLSLGAALSETDMRKCAGLWVSLEIADQLSALNYARQLAAGEWSRCEIRYVPRLWTYLEDKHWTRRAVVKGRDRPVTKSEESHNEAARRFMASERTK